MAWKETFRRLAPPILLDAYRGLRAPRMLEGRFATWAEAVAASGGYDAPVILERTLAAQRQVKQGKAAFARDGVAFSEPEAPLAILTVLLRQAALREGRLRVLDFGGSLGTLYFRCRPFLEGLREVSWRVVERPEIVRAGMAEFEDKQLTFSGAEDLGKQGPVDAVVLASVLQYLERPWEQLMSLLELKPALVVVDRTPFSSSGEGFLTVQKVPGEIYEASYPSWVFSRSKLERVMSEAGYALELSIPAVDFLDPAAIYCGLCFRRRN